MKIKVNRLPRVKLADLLEKYGLELTVEQVSPDRFIASINGFGKVARGQHGSTYTRPVTGSGDTILHAVSELCKAVSYGDISSIAVGDEVTDLGRIELIQPEESEIEEVP